MYTKYILNVTTATIITFLIIKLDPRCWCQNRTRFQIGNNYHHHNLSVGVDLGQFLTIF